MITSDTGVGVGVGARGIAIHPSRTSAAARSSRSAWRSAAAFGLALLERTLRPGYRPVLEPTKAANGSIGYAMVADSLRQLRPRFETFLGRCEQDAARKFELEALGTDLEHADDTGGGRVLVFLGRIRIHGENDEIVGEIDGLWLRADHSSVRWRVLEAKDARRAAGIEKQLHRLGDLLRTTYSGPSPVPVAGGKCSAIAFTTNDQRPTTANARLDNEPSAP